MTAELKSNSGNYPGENVHVSFNAVANGQLIYTVPTGKTFFVTGVHIECAGASVNMYLTDGVLTTWCNCYSPNLTGGIAFNQCGAIIFVMQSDQIAQLVTDSGASNCFVTLSGFLI